MTKYSTRASALEHRYRPEPCVRLSFFENGRITKFNLRNRKFHRQCSDPRTPAAGSVCCNKNNPANAFNWGDQCKFIGEYVVLFEYTVKLLQPKANTDTWTQRRQIWDAHKRHRTRRRAVPQNSLLRLGGARVVWKVNSSGRNRIAQIKYRSGKVV